MRQHPGREHANRQRKKDQLAMQSHDRNMEKIAMLRGALLCFNGVDHRNASSLHVLQLRH